MLKRFYDKSLNALLLVYGFTLFCAAFTVWYIAVKLGFKVRASSG